jgi:hypothetical protein
MSKLPMLLKLSLLEAIRQAAEQSYRVLWMIGGSPLELAAHFGPDYEPPGEEEMERKLAQLRLALDTYQKALQGLSEEG